MADHREVQKPYGEEIKSGTSDSILASLFRAILKDLNINIHRFNQLMGKYIIRANIPLNVKDVSSTRGNLKKELLKSVMTWKVFVKGLLFLNIKKFDITVRLYHASGTVTEHSRSVILDQEDELELEQETIQTNLKDNHGKS